MRKFFKYLARALFFISPYLALYWFYLHRNKSWYYDFIFKGGFALGVILPIAVTLALILSRIFEWALSKLIEKFWEV